MPAEPASCGVPAARLTAHAELLRASGDDVFVRWQVRSDVPLRAWAVGDAVAFVRTRASGRRQLTVLGEPSAAAAAVHTLVELDVEERASSRREQGEHATGATAPPNGAPLPATVTSHGITVPLGTLPLLGKGVRIGPGDDWHWMWVDHERLRLVARACSGSHPAPIRRCPRCSASQVHVTAATRATRTWWSGSASGTMTAGSSPCAAHTQVVPGVPHLPSIATHPDARGNGLGQALTATMCGQLLDQGAPTRAFSDAAERDAPAFPTQLHH
ncbi:MAG TPA: hypothetical protein VFL94_13745 [Actinomycetales bacterium]|nr:hypothetical protein [Actinomycetales bacterium]